MKLSDFCINFMSSNSQALVQAKLQQLLGLGHFLRTLDGRFIKMIYKNHVSLLKAGRVSVNMSFAFACV